MESIICIEKSQLLDELMDSEQEQFSKQELVERLIAHEEIDAEPVTTAKMTVNWGGFCIRHVECGNCKSMFDERTDFPYNFCPYCNARRDDA